ncbi:hypothetical protein [Ralstonia phage phiRSL1]|uniref:Uncharacterized protein n=1 Tax=Ralstonia phage phiRSL1 TaxID=1980924 RepID=B2ZY81_9CAUD|nr:hypothetical protein RSL1_ORF269 [Ralstonia phage phiRSL1]BAG41716.1 hypothetical protein [Ralstonia phage phiRSL1]
MKSLDFQPFFDMQLLTKGSLVELKGQWNTYQVLHADEKFAKIKCTIFVRREDLGDQIFCTHQDQEIWIAQFHGRKYEVTTF